MLTSDDFTPTETIETEFKPGDTTIDIVGYIKTIDSNAHTAFKTKFKKVVCSNANGVNVQITAWKDLIPKLNNIELGTIVHISGLKYNVPHEKFNKGNIHFELVVQDNSEVSTYDTYSEIENGLLPEEVSLLEAYDKIDQKIKVEAVMKTEPGIYQNLKFVSNVASITDMVHELELKLNFNIKELPQPLLKGISVLITGTMEKYAPGPPVLRVDCVTDIIILDNPRASFIDVLNGFHTKGIE